MLLKNIATLEMYQILFGWERKYTEIVVPYYIVLQSR